MSEIGYPVYFKSGVNPEAFANLHWKLKALCGYVEYIIRDKFGKAVTYTSLIRER
jgi:hypothetical protein